jgi:carbon-monoxide dehydrogenase medium subunit
VKPFTFLAPRALDEAVALLDEHGPDARVIAGGQSLLLALKDRLDRPSVLVSLGGVTDLRSWHYTDTGELEIGAATTYATLARADLRGWHAEIAAVAGNLADRPVRNMGTIGGALCQAEPRFDMPALAVALGAEVETVSAAGVVRRPADELFRPAGGTVLGPGEILTRIRIPAPETYSAAAFEKFRYRVFDAALVSAACVLRLDGDRVSGARLVVGAVRPTPVLVSGVGVGGAPTGADIEEIARAVADEVLPAAEATSRLQRYQRELIGVLTARAVTRALDQARS